MRKKLRRITSALRGILIVLVAVCAAYASEHQGRVTFGGLPVPGATVTASQGDKALTAVTDSQGVYSFTNLADGMWKIRVEMQCFTPIEREVAVAPDAPSPTWELKLQSFDEIKASAPVPPAAAPAPTAATAASAPAEAAPHIAAAAPAAVEPASGKGKKKKAKGEPAVVSTNGKSGFQRADLNASTDISRLESGSPSTAEMNQAPSDGLLVNGSVNNGAASQFAQAPAFGNGRRGVGSLYNGNFGLSMDNSYLDARPYSLTGQDTALPAYNHVTAMGSFGGPLKLGNLWHQAPPNFIVNYQWTRNRNANTESFLVPTVAQRAGDFSQGATILDPSTGQPFPGNRIPQDRMNSQPVQTLLGFYPLPNLNGVNYNYQVPLVGLMTQNSLQSRVNKSIKSKDQLFGSFAWQHSDNQNSNPNIFNFRDTTEMSGLNGSGTWSHRFGQRMFARLTLAFSRNDTRQTPYFANVQNVSQQAGVTGNNQDPINWGPPNLSFVSGIAGLSDQQASVTRVQAAVVAFNMFWNHRSHNVTYGGDFRRIQINLLAQQNARGSFSFTGDATGSDFADFLLSTPDTASIAYGNADKYLRTSWYDGYITDDWRVNSSLTLNVGVRWEYSTPITEKYGRLVNLDIAPGFTAVAPVIGFSPTGTLTGRKYADSLVNPDKGGFQPRIGLAWRPFAASSLVIRAGYGVTYNTSAYQTIAVQMSQQSPLSRSLSVSNTAENPLTLANGFRASPNITTNTFAIDPNFRIGYAQTWNVIVQRDLPGSLVVTATYTGIKGTRAVQAFLPNTYPAGISNPCATCLAGYEYMTSNGNSTREAGELQVRRRMHNGVTANLKYTYSKSIDDAMLGGRQQAMSLPKLVIAQNWLDLAAERGLSDFDQRHLLSLEMQYTTGMGIKGGALLNGWRGLLMKGWTVSSDITAGSGLPLTPVYAAAVRGTGMTGSQRPEYTGAALYDAPQGMFLNPNAYITPLSGQWGNAGRNSIIGPSRFSLDASLERTFRVTDKWNADLRVDSTNALNHVAFTSWGTTLDNAQFGLPTAVNAMRSMKVTLRVRF
jgi:hypothetical protein